MSDDITSEASETSTPYESPAPPEVLGAVGKANASSTGNYVWDGSNFYTSYT